MLLMSINVNRGELSHFVNLKVSPEDNVIKSIDFCCTFNARFHLTCNWGGRYSYILYRLAPFGSCCWSLHII